MPKDRPNVLLICADHWAAEHLGFAGHPAVLTSGLNEIASAGVRFTKAYSECPACIPARRTLMTGQSPKSHGDRVFNDQLSMPDVTTLAEAFRDAGHLADEHHATAWAGRGTARTIKRRDPTRPAFWYLGFRHPHPPLVPPQGYVDLYRDVDMDEVLWGRRRGCGTLVVSQPTEYASCPITPLRIGLGLAL